MLFSIGGLAYGAIEIVWRQHTHWTMIVTGGACFMCLYRFFEKRKDMSLFKKCVSGSAIISGVEFFTGLIVNVACKMNVWDYSNLPFNIMGQISLIYSFLWGLLTIPITFVCKKMNKVLLYL